MNWGLLRTIIILPGSALVFIPALILWVTGNTPYAASMPDTGLISFRFSLILFGIGLVLAFWTTRLLLTCGEGTPAPWDPPKKLVVRGPYRYVRNPMITSVMFMLLAEALLFRSWPLAGWLIIFFLANAIYFPLVEERGLKKRFGEDYLQYQANVPRWFPRLMSWTPPPENHEH
ncbi:MAG: isoprenylcysteine carboxylmethyltransferase family protein [Mariprofundaceae bacterium]|nr:isoprenylcysteine carboxylmethyltransferase family protein [Mariprofundaceae bacterium]